MTSGIKSFEDLEVWVRGIDLTVRLYAVTRELPKSEQYELSSQIRRAAVSVPSNVAEGHARRAPKPFLNHVHISLGSLAEIVTCLIVANRVGFISSERLAQERCEADTVGRMLHGLARSLEERIEKQENDRRQPRQLSALSLGLIVGVFAGWLAAFV